MKFYITENAFLGLPQEGRQLQSVQILCRLLFTAARIGEEKFTRLVFGTSAGRAAFEAYKNKPPLPENIADENGHEKIAAYLRSITERYLNSKLFQFSTMKKRCAEMQYRAFMALLTLTPFNFLIKGDVTREDLQDRFQDN